MDSVNQGYQAPDVNQYPSENDDEQAWFSQWVPPDRIALIDEQTPVGHITNATSPEQAIEQTYAISDGRLRYFGALGAIHGALESDCDTPKVLSALLAIEKLPVMSQPHLMRTFAEKAHGLAKIAPDHDLAEWGQMVVGVEASLIRVNGPEWRGPQLRDLYIANVLAQFLPCAEQAQFSLEQTLDRQMHAFPPREWGDFMEVADTINMSLVWDDWVTFLSEASALSRPASDRFARSIGLNLLAFRALADPVRCLENFGITKTQIGRIIIPSFGIALARDVIYGSTTLTAECSRWGSYAKQLRAEVEASIFLNQVDAVRHNESSMLQIKTCIDIAPQRQHERRMAFIRQFECDTIQALGDNQIQIDAFLENWQFASTAADSVDEWVRKFALLTAKTVPLVTQPALLDRWALGLSKNIAPGRPPANAISLRPPTPLRDRPEPALPNARHPQTDTSADIGAIAAFVKAYVTLRTLQHDATSSGRMAVALIHTLDAHAILTPHETFNVQKRLITTLFEKTPPTAWQWMLELSLSDRRSDQMDAQERLLRFTEFVLDPRTTASLTTSAFCFSIIGAASYVLEALPDHGDGVRSKFEVFCDRFGIPEKARPSAKTEMLYGIVRRATSGKFTLAEGLSLGGFDTDIDACQYARKAFRYGIDW